MPRKNTANKTSHRCKKIPLILELLIAVMTENGRARMPPAPKTACKRNKSNRLPISMLTCCFENTSAFAALWLLFAEIHQTPDLQKQTAWRYLRSICYPEQMAASFLQVSQTVRPRIVSTARTRRSSITGKVRIGQSTSRNFARTSSL